MCQKNTKESDDKTASIEINPEYTEAMKDMKVNEKYTVIFYFHKSHGYSPVVPLRGNGPMKELFSTHSPHRPNPIGISTITVKKIKDNIIYFTGIDMLDKTPVLDIKKEEQ